MSSVTVSPKYQVVIPKKVREKIRVKPGDKFQVLSFDDRIELVRTRPLRKMRGFLRGLDSTFIREENDRV